MFSGTLRENLDPYHEHSDFELYNLIVETGLKEQVRPPWPLRAAPPRLPCHLNKSAHPRVAA